jgi:type IX secretion system PorP/SprF family membrane protein
MKNIIRVIAVVLLLSPAIGYGQGRPTYSTYMYNGLAINPAYAGSQNMFSAIFTNRNQWVNIEGAPNFQSLTAQTTFMSNQVGVGLNVSRDAIGSHVQYAVYGSYAYKIKMNRNILSMGLQGGFDQLKSDFRDIDLADPDDPILNGIVTKFNPNFGLGLYLANRNWFVGLSVPQVLQPKIRKTEEISSEGKQARSYFMNAGFVKDITAHIKVNPSTLIRKEHGGVLSFDVNVNLIFDELIYAGVSYRHQDAIVLITQMLLNENFRIGYAYDFPTSELGPFTTGTHEIFLNYRIKIKNTKKDAQCPVYF